MDCQEMSYKEMNELRDELAHLNGFRWVKIKNLKCLKTKERVRYINEQGEKIGFEPCERCYIVNSQWFGKVIADFTWMAPLIHCIEEEFESDIKTLEVFRKVMFVS